MATEIRARPEGEAAEPKRPGFPNDALVSYIQAAQTRAGCPGESG